ncbi:MAG: Ig-like domain-containing protein, partial [Calditrichia bacterium]|nr:Ig-like domain-containing protein [Calditrichia bacterium]
MLKRFSAIFFLIFLFVSTLFADQGGKDNFGYMWTNSDGTVSVDYEWIDARDGTNLFTVPFNNDTASVVLPFNFVFYGGSFSKVWVSTNGWISFTQPSGSYPGNTTIPAGAGPDSMIAVFWDNIIGETWPAGEGGVYYKTLGTTPNRRFVIQWDIQEGQWNENDVNFEVILYEQSNQIKFQYYWLASQYNGGGSATIGIKQNTSVGIEYSFNQASAVDALTAILHHNKFVNGASASISPTSVEAGAVQTFNYYINNIDPTDTTGLGKLDSVVIGNPFLSTPDPVVTGVKINNHNAFIQMSSNKPTEAGFATWQINADSIIIQSSHFDIIDSLKVTFQQYMPTAISSDSVYGSSINAVLDSSSQMLTTQGTDWSVDIIANTVSYYTMTPTGNDTIAAGDTLSYTITAYDQYGNTVPNDDTVTLSAVGSSTAEISPGPYDFASSDTIAFWVSDSLAGLFTVQTDRNGVPPISVQSGLITVTADTTTLGITKVTSDTTGITAGSSLTLLAQITDAFFNVVGGDSVRFIVRSGNGNFSGLDSIGVASESLFGIASATYTTGDTAGTNIVTALRVDNRADSVQFSIGTVSGGVSYYSLSPSTDSTIVAGDSIAYTLLAHDQYGNRVATSDSVTLTAVGSFTAGFSPGLFEFGGADSLLFAVSDTTAGSFTVRADNIDNSAITGSSGLITILPGDVTSIIQLSSADSINVGGERLLQYALEDVYGNRLSDSLVTFTRFNGNGLFSNGSSTIDTLTNVSGIAQANYTASDVFSFGSDSIEINYGTLYDTLSLPLRSSLVSYYTLSPSGDNTITAGDSIAYTVTVRDQFGNAIGSDGGIIPDAVGSITAGFSPSSYNFNNDSTLQFRVSDFTAGSFTVRVEDNGNSAIIGQSGLIIIDPASVDSLLFTPSGDQITNAGTSIKYVITAIDQFGNFVPNNETIDFTFIGSASATSSPAGPITFNNTDTIIVDITDTETGTFSVSANVQGFPLIDGESGLITVTTASPHHMVKTVGTEDSLTVGETRVLQVQVFDEYDNPIPGRVADSLTVLYTFDEGSGTQVTDVSGNGIPMNLTIENPGSVAWDNSGFLDINNPARISAADQSKVYNSLTSTNEMTVEAWITPSRIGGNSGPARIVTLSSDGSNRNFTLAQEGTNYYVRLRTTSGGDGNGMPDIITPGSLATQDLTHLVFTRDVSGQYYIYVNGNEVVSGNRGGDFSNWDAAYEFGLGAEFDEPLTSRDWWGDLHLVAVYNQALDSLHVVRNYLDGANNSVLFSRTSSGDGVFVAGDSSAQSAAINTSGYAGANYQASTMTVFGTDIIEASIGDVNETFVIPLRVDTPSNLVVSDTSGVVGSSITLRVRLEDQYANPISNATINFSESGNGSLSSPTAVTDATGYTQVVYTLGTDTSASPEQVTVEYTAQSLSEIINITLLPDTIVSYYTLTPAADSTIAAGDSITYTLRAFDQFNNAVASNDSVTLSAVGSSTAGFSPGPYEFNGADSLLFSVSDSLSGSFTVRAENIDNPAITVTSGLITITPDSATISIAKVSGDGSGIIAGSDRLLRVRVTDSFANVVSGDSIRFIVRSGGGDLSGLDSIDVITNGSGIAEATLTTGIIADSNIVTALLVDNRADSVQFGIGT